MKQKRQTCPEACMYIRYFRYKQQHKVTALAYSILCAFLFPQQHELQNKITDQFFIICKKSKLNSPDVGKAVR